MEKTTSPAAVFNKRARILFESDLFELKNKKYKFISRYKRNIDFPGYSRKFDCVPASVIRRS